MSLVSAFIAHQLLSLIETEYANHSDEMKSMIVNEIEDFGNQALAWAESKTDELMHKGIPPIKTGATNAA